jgi:uncharacterized protein YbjT (DUF2867 family)
MMVLLEFLSSSLELPATSAARFSQLTATGVRVRALARNPRTAGLPPHVDVVRGDLGLDRPAGRRHSLSGADPQAHAAHRIPLLSVQDSTPLLPRRAANPVAARHAQIERLIETSGRPWTFLRPGMFAAKCPVLVGAADPRRRRCRAPAPCRRSYSSDPRAGHRRSRGPRLV